MDRADWLVLQQAQQWLAQAQRVVLATVVRTWGSAPRPVGSFVALNEAGLVMGSVSGGCIEDVLSARAREGTLFSATPQRVRYGINADEAHRLGLPCGGTLELVIETLRSAEALNPFITHLDAGRTVRRHLDLATGAVQLDTDVPPAALILTDTTLITTHGPQLRLILMGANQLTHYVAHMAVACDYAVIVCDPREETTGTWNVPGTDLLRTMPDDTVLALKPDTRTAVIALTHDPKLDDLALMEALKSEAFYVGAIGSRANQAKRRERLLEFGVTAEQLARLHGPVGLRIGARTPAEIAVAILAELTAVRYGACAHSPPLASSVTPLYSPGNKLFDSP